jgi:hypothetical protein
MLACGSRAGEPAGTVVLDGMSHWQVERTWVPGLARTQDRRLVPLVPGAGLKGPAHALVFKPEPGEKYDLPKWPALPADWAAPGFDDSAWTLHRGPVSVNDCYSMRNAFTPRWNFSLARMRGRFLVNDPAAVGALKLDIAYQGGVVVYLNGAEVARGHLPEGAVTPDTPAADYADADTQRRDEWVRCDKMDRRLIGVSIPASRLVRGVNVLAIEAHRSPMPEKMLRDKNHWIPLEVLSIRLSAPSAAGLVPNAGQPAGLHVWTGEPTCLVRADDLGDRSLENRPIRIVACRNSSFSGQAVIYNEKPLGQVKGTVGELRTADGAAALPAAAFEVRYPIPDRRGIDGSETGVYGPHNDMNWFDALQEVLPAEVPLRFFQERPHLPKQFYLAVQPVWVTVRVPADAKPGEYKGQLQLEIAGQSPVKVPVEVKVHDFRMPDPKDFSTFLEMHHSPETLAYYYKVPLWSEEHWKLIERSFELTAQAGNKLVFIPLFARARFGNDHGMLRFVRKGDGWEYDFSVIERYLDLAIKHFDRNMVVVWHITEPAHDDTYWKIRHAGKVEPQKNPQITVLDPKDGALSLFKAPLFGTPEARAFWKPVCDRIAELVKKKGLTKRALILGTEQDLGVSKAFLDDIKNFAPDFKWSRCTHPTPPPSMRMPNGLEIGYASDVYGGVLHHTPEQQRNYGWKWRDDEAQGVHAHWPRNFMTDEASLGKIHHVMETHIVSSPYGIKQYGYAGLSYQGAEFWPVSVAEKSRGNTLIDRFPESIWGSISIGNGAVAWLAPGPKGAIATVRFEVLREGIEEANVRVFIERALTDPAARGKLGEDLAARAQALLDERQKILDKFLENHSGIGARREKLLAVAAEAAGKLASKR